MSDEYLAHIAGERKQTVREHLCGTSELCGSFADEFGCADHGIAAGRLHDLGKFTKDFQKRLRGGPKVDHSTAGAYECFKCGQIPEAFCIAGHHGGLPDGGSRADISGSSFFARMYKAKSGLIPDYSAWLGKIEHIKTMAPDFCRKAPDAMFFTRMLFSCLTDADYTDTENFMTGIVREKCISDMMALDEKLDSYTQNWYPPKNELNTKRCAILDCCKKTGADTDRGVFTLTVPTGGGKTVASLAFALRHAKRNGMRRIIYVIPYTSIIEQTAESFRNILGAENVLEHHSGVLFDIDENSTDDDIKRAHASENWEIPVVVTTAVQFFESLFSNRPSKCRKLHNIANSVVIFDEAQMLPLPYLLPCVFAISQLYEHYRVSAVLCTATQPDLNKMFGEYLPQTEITEICPAEYFDDDVFRRVVFRKAGKMSWNDVCDEMNGVGQALCIVNSRKNAKELFDGLGEDGRYHLSTLMYPMHRKAVLAEIREHLAAGKICRVAATSLVEAGVDVDFPRVFREMAGLDSILQAAGRCNREGKRPPNESVVTVFDAESKVPPLFSAAIAAGSAACESCPDISGKEAVKLYFDELYDLKGEAAMDKNKIMHIMNTESFPFKKLADSFRLIDNDTRTVYIPDDGENGAVKRLMRGECSRELYREAGQYAVSVYERHFNSLLDGGALFLLDDGSAVLTRPELYSEKTGLSLDADSGQALFV